MINCKSLKNLNYKFLCIIIVITLFVPLKAFASDVRGLFTFIWAGDVQKYGLPRSIDLPYINGATIVTEWRLLQPSKYQFRWYIIDDVIEQALIYDKIINIGIFPGSTSPEFVLKGSKNVTASRNVHLGEAIANKNAVNKIIFPLPWDKYYNNEWLSFMYTFSRRYGSNNHIGYLQISGPSVTAMEMMIRIQTNEWQMLRDSGYTEDIYINCWKNNIDKMAEIWPGKLAITLGNSIPDKGIKYSNYVWEVVAKYAINKLGDRLILKLAFLNGKWWQKQNEHDHAKLLIDFFKSISSSTYTGAEMLWMSSVLNESVNGPLNIALDNGIKSGMKFIEIYQEDIARYESPTPYYPYISTLKAAHSVLNTN